MFLFVKKKSPSLLKRPKKDPDLGCVYNGILHVILYIIIYIHTPAVCCICKSYTSIDVAFVYWCMAPFRPFDG